MAAIEFTKSGGPRVGGSLLLRVRHNLTVDGGPRVGGSKNLNAGHNLIVGGGPRVGGQLGLELTPPAITTAVPSASTTIRLTFDTGMLNNLALADPLNYAINSTGAGVAVAVNAVVPEAVAEPTYVDLTVTEMTNGEPYAAVAQVIEDPAGVTIDPTPTAFTGLGVAPRVSSAAAVNSTKVRVTFDEPMDRNGSELADLTNYSITPGGAGAVAVFINEVLFTGLNPTVVDLVTSEMTDGEPYDLAVDTSGNIRDAAENPLDAGFATAVFTGAGDAPELFQVEPISSTRVDVTFNETMRDNADIRDPASYAWDNGLVTLSVLDFDTDTVKLVTSEQTEGLLYQLTIG